MKRIQRTLLSLLAVTVCADADVPRKALLSKYRGLWDNSPFTTKPIVDNGPAQDDAFEDYTLAGVSPVQGGYRVTLMKRNDPSDRTFVYPNDPQAKHGFRILSVERDPNTPRSTVVRMKSGSRIGTVTYDEKLLTIAAPKPQQGKIQNRPVQQGGRNIPVNNQAGSNVQTGTTPANPTTQGAPRAPRPRVIGPPPTPNNTSNSNDRAQRRNIIR